MLRMKYDYFFGGLRSNKRVLVPFELDILSLKSNIVKKKKTCK